MLQTANEAYKVVQLRQYSLSAFQALFLATLGGARALCLDDRIGNEEVGKEAEFVVLDLRSTRLQAFRNSATPATPLQELADRAFNLIIMGDDRAVRATYLLSELAYRKIG